MPAAIPIATSASQAAAALVARLCGAGRSLLDVLHALQQERGYVPPDTLAPLALAFNLSRAEVHGVLTYYHFFRTAPPPATVIQLCRAEACRSMGTEQLAAHIEICTGARFQNGSQHATDGPVALESVYCLGQCALSPALTLNGRLHAKVTPQKFDALLAACQSRAAAGGEPR